MKDILIRETTTLQRGCLFSVFWFAVVELAIVLITDLFMRHKHSLDVTLDEHVQFLGKKYLAGSTFTF